MKYSIEGFSQQRLVELKMDATDAVLLRFFIDFKETGKMVKEIVDGEQYYWFKYDHVLQELPIIGIKKDTLYRRLKKMVEVGILKHHTVRRGGTYSFYTMGEQYLSLICSYPTDLNPEGVRNKIREGTEINPEQNINLQEDSSIKDIINSATSSTMQEEIESLWKLYPCKKGKSKAVKSISKLIAKYGYNKLVSAIEKYVEYVEKQHSTGFNLQYQNGSTFFNGTYEDYIEEENNITTSSNTPKEIIEYVFDMDRKIKVTKKYAIEHNLNFIEAPEA